VNAPNGWAAHPKSHACGSRIGLAWTDAPEGAHGHGAAYYTASAVELSAMQPTFRLPLHEYGLLHEGGGNRAASCQHAMVPLLWGEGFYITDDGVALTR